MDFSKVERVSLPEMLVASHEVTSSEPEQAAKGFMENWMMNRGLNVGLFG